MKTCLSNCETCDHFWIAKVEDGYCYMWKDEPKGVCYQHTGYRNNEKNVVNALASFFALIKDSK